MSFRLLFPSVPLPPLSRPPCGSRSECISFPAQDIPHRSFGGFLDSGALSICISAADSRALAPLVVPHSSFSFLLAPLSITFYAFPADSPGFIVRHLFYASVSARARLYYYLPCGSSSSFAASRELLLLLGGPVRHCEFIGLHKFARAFGNFFRTGMPRVLSSSFLFKRS